MRDSPVCRPTMTAREIQTALRKGERVYGTAILSDSPFWPPYIQQIGLDFIFIDTEHVPVERKTLSWMCRTYSALGLPPIVRIPSHEPSHASQALDGGAQGIIVPYVEHISQLEPVIGATKQRPIKGERLRQRQLGETPFEADLEAYLQSNNQSNLMVANIESTPGIRNLGSILQHPDLDAVLIGPHDLSCSLGIPEQYEHPRFKEAVAQIFTQARHAGKGAGMHFVHGLDQHIELAQLGENFIIHSDCIHLIRDKLTEDLTEFKQVLDGKQHQPNNASLPII